MLQVRQQIQQFHMLKMQQRSPTSLTKGNEEIRIMLEQRLGRVHAGQRLGIEREHEAQIFGQGLNWFHIENLTASHVLIRTFLMVTGLYWRGLRNAKQVSLTHNMIKSPRLPLAFHGYTLLQISDLHVDMNLEVMERVESLVDKLDYDACVLTGDYRGKTFGPIEDILQPMAHLMEALNGDVYGVLGNHDTIAMVPGLEDMGIRMLLNEKVVIERDKQRIHVAGIDDAHFYQVDNIEKAAAGIPHEEFSILISHTPEIYRHAAHAGFDVLISGHTHGGQICLPGGAPLTLDSNLPRRMGSGSWNYHDMIGYTSRGAGSSVVPVRFNCPPEITLHHFQSAT
jgi:predicted MPP superfamily phosphohydrolase